ncbi:MAG: hypothetical protein NUV97_00945 [archaeon]|nr:hypothetical protein [archaeon]MCR4323472.1 hypothetical protein [Nanoarchaeota archaeon]
MKYLIFDSGPIISLTMSGMISVLEKLKGVFKGEFIITPSVKREVIDRPMKIPKYKLEAIQVKDFLDRGILKLSSSIIQDDKLDKETKNVLKITNGVLRITQTGEKIKIIQEGEASCLAFANLCKCDSVIVVDERTTRLLTEAPQTLEKLMEKKLHTPLDAELSLLEPLKRHRFIRSPELLYIAYKKNLIPIKKSRDLLDALLYGVKFKGAAISDQEIEEIKRIG